MLPQQGAAPMPEATSAAVCTTVPASPRHFLRPASVPCITKLDFTRGVTHGKGAKATAPGNSAEQHSMW